MRCLRAIRLLLTLRCQESEALISRSLDESLPGVERWAVRLHFISCRTCRHFKKQLLLIHDAAVERGHLDARLTPHSELPASARARIANVLRITQPDE